MGYGNGHGKLGNSRKNLWSKENKSIRRKIKEIDFVLVTKTKGRAKEMEQVATIATSS